MADNTKPEAAATSAATIADGAGRRLAYHRLPGRAPGIIFLGGFMSDMTGIKATTLEAACRTSGRGFLRFDYSGHGASEGRFVDGTIGGWAADAVTVLDALTEGPQVLVGSSMGGWLMVLAALARPDRVAGLVGIAAAPDFTEELIWQAVPEAVRKVLLRDGVWHEPSAYGAQPYPITLRLIEEGRDRLVLRAPIGLACPVRLLHGVEDRDVPWTQSQKLMERLETADVTLTLVKDGDHRLSRPQDIARLIATVEALADQVADTMAASPSR